MTAFLATWMNVEINILSEVSQTMRHQDQMLSLMWNLKKGHDELLCRTDTDSNFEKLMVSKGERLGSGKCWGFRIEMLFHCTTINVINPLSNKKRIVSWKMVIAVRWEAQGEKVF